MVAAPWRRVNRTQTRYTRRAMNDLVRYFVQDGVAVLCVDNPPVNALSPGVPEGLEEGVRRAEDDPSAVAVVDPLR